jgi:hypothetical protein
MQIFVLKLRSDGVKKRVLQRLSGFRTGHRTSPTRATTAIHGIH